MVGIRRQDIAPILLHWLGFSYFRQRVYRWRGSTAARFIVFHDISPSETAAFEAKLRFLRDHTCVIAQDAFFNGKLCPGSPNVVITFDDGYKGWSTIAAPALKRLALPATFFVTSGLVGLNREREADFMRNRLKIGCSSTGGLTEVELRRLALDGFTIGSHTSTHANLAQVKEAAIVEQELKEDKQRLEQVVGKQVRHFAYPFGAHQNSSLNLSTILRRVGFCSACTLTAGFNTSRTNPFELRRDLTSADLALSAFKARVLGNQDPIAFLKMVAGRRGVSLLRPTSP
jgi:peptidoglycan/xylan/chitin deacetylase (PgdA/CDA1 family)